MGCIRKVFGLVGHSLSAIFQHAQLVATLVERLTRLLHLGCYAAGLVSQCLQVSGWSRDVAGNAPTGFTRWLTNWKKINSIKKKPKEMKWLWDGKRGWISSETYRVLLGPVDGHLHRKDLWRNLLWVARAFHTAWTFRPLNPRESI